MNRQERRQQERHAKTARKVSLLKALGNSAGFDMRRCAVMPPERMVNFKDIDAGIEDFTRELRDIGFKWEDYRRHGGRVLVNLVLTQTTQHEACAGEFPASSLCENGEELCEFAVAAAFYTIIEEAIRSFEQQLFAALGKVVPLCVPLMVLHDNGQLNITIMRV